ncbi:metallophosphoesterase [Halopseudomonas aestusnigri]|uniref:metallophosphoesterase n=1 Tax=Halopseudomonas aestusnigri TaxID=857252 RepID=UPI003D7CCB55
MTRKSEQCLLTCVCISDTHGLHQSLPPLPDCDVLIHAGDCLGSGSVKSLEAFAEWFESQPPRHKILVAGNHDDAIEKYPELIPTLLPTTHYLQDSGIEIGGVKFWGAPWTRVLPRVLPLYCGHF